MSKVVLPDQGIPDVYADMADGCVNALSSFYDDMEELCRTHGYKPMVDFTNSIQKFYSEQFRSHVMLCFEQWENSESSLTALIRGIRAGSGAEITARNYMAQLRERLEGMFTRSFSPVRVDEDSLSLDEHDIEKIGGYIRAFLAKANQAKENALYTAKSKSAENMLYSLISPVLENTGESLCQSFESMIKAVLEGTELYIEEIKNAVESRTKGPQIDNTVSVKWPDDVTFY